MSVEQADAIFSEATRKESVPRFRVRAVPDVQPVVPRETDRLRMVSGHDFIREASEDWSDIGSVLIRMRSEGLEPCWSEVCMHLLNTTGRGTLHLRGFEILQAVVAHYPLAVERRLRDVLARFRVL